MMGFFKTVLAVATALLGIQKEVCYHGYGIGCFNNKRPYDNANHYLPQLPAKIMVTFRLFTRHTTGATTISDRRLPNFDGAKRTKFIIHGFVDDGSEKWISDMRKAILKRENVNVVVVGWDRGANNVLYEQAAANTRVVGALLARLMTSLRTKGGAKYEDMHLIGHSLGAHIAGYAGERIKGIGRITGLDPAGPLFEKKDQRVRLDPTDATFVDVIHTDGENLVKLGVGMKRAIGDVDFFPNGGHRQPGCKKKSMLLVQLLKLKLKKFVDGAACSHSRAYVYFTESINSACTFQAFPCKTCRRCGRGCASMGYDADRNNPRGNFYLTTRSSSPFCRA